MNSFFIVILLLFVSCSSLQSDKTAPTDLVSASPKHKKEFENALNDLENKRYESAGRKFKALAKKHSSGPIYRSALFNAASAFEKLKKCQKSESILSHLLDTVKKEPAFSARVLLRLSYSYECLGQIHQALSALKSLEENKQYLPLSTREVEIPARFSLLYAGLGDEKKALSHQNMALSGLKTVKTPIRDPVLLNQTAGKLFYIMGRSMTRTDRLQLKHYLKALPYQQIYLAQSIILSDPVWSVKSARELSQLYRKLWQVYKKKSVNEKLRHKNKISKALSKLQQISKESEHTKLKKIINVIVSKSIKQFNL